MDDDVQQQIPPTESHTTKSPIGGAPSSRLLAPRWMLALVVILAVLLLATTSALVFGPSIGLLHFGSASNQPPSGQHSAGSFETPSPAPASPSASPAATSTPLAGQTPTSSPPTATPTPTVIPSGAVVTFTARTASISKNNFTGCASGCDFATANGTGNGSLASGASYGPSGWQSTEVAGPYNVTLQSERYCYQPLPGSDYKRVTGFSVWNPNNYGNPRFTLQSSNFSCSGITIPSVSVGGTVHSSWCWWPTTQNPVAANRFCGTTSYQSPLASDQSFYTYSFSFCNAQWNSVQHYTYVTSSDCDNAISSADPKAKSAASSAASSWIAGRVSLYQNLAPVTTSSVRYCSPGINARNTSTTGYVEWSWSETVFDPNLVVSTAETYVRGHVPASYVLTSGPSTGSVAQARSNYNYPGGYNGTVTVSCAASGTTTFDWTSSTQGMSAQASLKQALKGKTLSQAQSMCNNNYPGIVPGSCTIQLTGGNVSLLPSDGNRIQVRPH